MIIEKMKKIKFIIIFFTIFCISYLSFDLLVEKRIKEDIKFWVDDNINYKLDIITKALQKNKNVRKDYVWNYIMTM